MISLLIDGPAKGQLHDIDGSYFVVAQPVQFNSDYKKSWWNDETPFTDLSFKQVAYHKCGIFNMPNNDQVAIFSVDPKATNIVSNDEIFQMYMVACYGEHWNSLTLKNYENFKFAEKTATVKNIYEGKSAKIWDDLDKIIKEQYLPAIKKQLNEELKPWWKGILDLDNLWLRAGLVSNREELTYLCRECVDMLYWPGANSPLANAAKSSGRHSYRTQCSYCGPGYFDKEGVMQRAID